MNESLQFRNNNPGAVQYGNFINYYQFNLPENRLEVFPLEVLDNIANENTKIFCLDIGCNTGDLTIKLQEMLETKLKKDCFVLGVDIDATLIARAREKSNAKTQFLAFDFMNEEEREAALQKYLLMNDIECFDVTFCFSVTMWIHLNHGDLGLEIFIHNICKNSKFIFVEPQTWNSYRTAVKRLKLAGEEFPHFKTIKLGNNTETVIEEILLKHKAKKIHETSKTKFKRKIYVFKIDK